MKLSIKKIGNSSGVILPTALMKSMNLSVGTVLNVETVREKLVLSVKPKRPHYSLADLLAQCDMNAPQDPVIEEWQNIRPVGKEVI